MIDRQGGKVVFSCDSCDSLFEGDRGEAFEDVWKAAKWSGWTTRKIAKEWLHGCPECGAPT